MFNLGFGWGGVLCRDLGFERGGVNPKFWPKGGGYSCPRKFLCQDTEKKNFPRASRAENFFFERLREGGYVETWVLRGGGYVSRPGFCKGGGKPEISAAGGGGARGPPPPLNTYELSA